jgi:hypothetical protein
VESGDRPRQSLATKSFLLDPLSVFQAAKDPCPATKEEQLKFSNMLKTPPFQGCHKNARKTKFLSGFWTFGLSTSVGLASNIPAWSW